MIEFHSKEQQTIPCAMIKIIGLGGAGLNILDRVAIDGIEGAELLSLTADVRQLGSSVVTERIQLGRQLVKGNGAGGDPELGVQAMQEAEREVRMSLKGRKIVFLCVGLGGGTGSGGAPLVTRIAREEGAFVVVFATMPFGFEGRRRREQAETALNELAVLSNALVVFDNNRMGELVLAKQGIHEAFAAADRMIAESIKAVIRLVIRPGLIRIGLDELMSALRTNRSRCLFGSGLAHGKDRASKALANALASPLLDSGALLKQAMSVLVHVCGGDDLTLYEVDLLMQKLMRHVPDKAHVLFGAAIDTSMKDGLSITLISALPEEVLQRQVDPQEEEREKLNHLLYLEPSVGFAPEEAPMANADMVPAPLEVTAPAPSPFTPVFVDAEFSATDTSIPVTPHAVAELTRETDPVPDVVAKTDAEFQLSGFQPTEFEAPSPAGELPLQLEPETLAVGGVAAALEAQDEQANQAGDFLQNEANGQDLGIETPVSVLSAHDEEWRDEYQEPVMIHSAPVEVHSSFQHVDLYESEAEQETYVRPEDQQVDPFAQLADQTRLRLQQEHQSRLRSPNGRPAGADQSLFDGNDLEIPAFLRSRRRKDDV